MKVVKIKNVKKFNYEMVEKELLEEGFNFSNWNFPNKDSYVIIKDGEIIPAYINVKDGEALNLWVSPKYRRQGLATFLIKSTNVKYATSLPSSISFWQSTKFKRIKTQFIQV